MAMSGTGLITAPTGTAEMVDRSFDAMFPGLPQKALEKQIKQIKLSKLTDEKSKKIYKGILEQRATATKTEIEDFQAVSSKEMPQSNTKKVSNRMESQFSLLDNEYEKMVYVIAKPARLEAKFIAAIEGKSRKLFDLKKQQNHDNKIEPVSVSTIEKEEPTITMEHKPAEEIVFNAEELQNKINAAFMDSKLNEEEEVTRVLPSNRGVKSAIVQGDKEDEVVPREIPREQVISVADMKRDEIEVKQDEREFANTEEITQTVDEKKVDSSELDALKKAIAALQSEVEQGKAEVQQLHTSVSEEKARSEQAKESFNEVKAKEEARKQALEQARSEQQEVEEEKKEVQKEVEKTTAEVKNELLRQKEAAEKLKIEVEKEKEELLSQRANAQQEQQSYEIKAKDTQAEISRLDVERQKIQNETQMTREEISQMQLKEQEIRKLVGGEEPMSMAHMEELEDSSDKMTNSSIFDKSSPVSTENKNSINPEIDKLMELLSRGADTALRMGVSQQTVSGGRTK